MNIRVKLWAAVALGAVVSALAEAPEAEPYKFEPSNNKFVTALDGARHYSKSLDGDILALWQSHGRYYNTTYGHWGWQRCRLFGQVEDLYTQSYVLPYLVPMLENAGAYVMLPRERDMSTVEVIVDNDLGRAQTNYDELGKGWSKGEGTGFGYKKNTLNDGENPFTMGTYRQVAADADGNSIATWSAIMPESGTYALYVSYKSLPESVNDAVYIVKHEGGENRFAVNQRMGGGTWVYLGDFPLKQGRNENVVRLTSKSKCEGGIVTADAIKIGGGMGNIARGGKVSGTPRFNEGARYFLQWAGVPRSVYSKNVGKNDYKDDYMSRGHWVNYLAGGSKVAPDSVGLKIPVDLAFALHSDAGVTDSDSIIGSMGIVYTKSNGGRFADRSSRSQSTTLANLITDGIAKDVRKQFEPRWTRRKLKDAKYYEARVPEVPTVLLELLSHQNFADMKYGLDPNFRFTVSRAIYKAMLQFEAKRKGRSMEVQPLPVNSFAINATKVQGKFELSWTATRDTLTNSGAMPTKYLVRERIDNGAFRDFRVVSGNSCTVKVAEGEMRSYQVIAINDGGRSFPSETLSVGVASFTSPMVMVVNGFTRVSAPDWFCEGSKGGFVGEHQVGVPYIRDISYTGKQVNFNRFDPWISDAEPGFGKSKGDYETKIVAGNTFDYTTVHGDELLDAGFSFVSSSVAAVENGAVSLDQYPAVDLILGKQRTTKVGRGAKPDRYKVIPKPLQKAIERYIVGGGSIFISGEYVVSDMTDDDDVDWMERVLGCCLRSDNATSRNKVVSLATSSLVMSRGKHLRFCNELNDVKYCVDEPDAVDAINGRGEVLLRYASNSFPAAVATVTGKGKSVVMGFPYESIQGSDGGLMNAVMLYLLEK